LRIYAIMNNYLGFKYMVRIISLRCFILLVVFITGKVHLTYASRLEGFEPDYAGRTIEFVTWTDPVSKTEKQAFTLRIGPQGRIQVETGVTETLFCYADFDVYRAKLIVKPGETLRIKLPPLKEKSFEESKNPYFQPIELWVMVQSPNPEELNTLFARFDQRFFELNQKYFNQLYFRQQRSFIDSVKIPLEKEFGGVKSPLFQYNKALQYKSIEAGILRTGREKLLGSLKDMPEQAWSLPVFSELTDRLLNNALSLESKSTRGAAIRSMVARQDLSELMKWTASFTGAKAPLTELLVVKLLHDAFYSGDFPKNAILATLQLPEFRNHANRTIRETARSVVNKLQFLYPGTDAPVICLPGLKGDTICSKSATKPYQYILFADLEIPVGQEQVKYLTDINQRIGDKVDILLVLTPARHINNQEFITANNVPGRVVLDTPSRTTGRKFNIRSYPSAILINRQHKVVLSPAKTPLDGFEHQLAGVR